MKNNEYSSWVKQVSIIILTLLFFFLIEGTSYLLLMMLPELSYDENKISQTFEEYLENRDNVLGWNKIVDKYGNSRNLPNRKYVNDTIKQIDLYGDSFTYGAEVEDDSKIWSNIISKEINLIVNNKGVGGYGSDQSYLKFKFNKNPSEIVVLNHLSENIIRNVNQFRHLIYPSNYYDLKPRFIIDRDSLKLVDIPLIPIEEAELFKNNPNLYLDHEFFSIGQKAGIYFKKFPYSYTLLKSLFSNWKIKSQLNFYSGYQPFYNLKHSSNGIKITSFILEKFVREAKSKGLRPVITIIPTFRDFQFYKKYGHFPYETLVKELHYQNYFIDFGKEINNLFLDLDAIESLYISKKGHMNENGHKILARIFIDFLLNKDLL